MPLKVYFSPMSKINEVEPISGDGFCREADHVFWDNNESKEDRSFRHGDVVFCHIDQVWRLFRALRRSTDKIILVTGHGCKPVDSRLWEQVPPHVAHWFGTNMFVEAPNAHPIPLGLGNASCRVTLKDPKFNVSRSPESRPKLLYVNFRTATEPKLRVPILQHFKNLQKPWVTIDDPDLDGSIENYRTQLTEHAFVLCPPGRGEDTHRMWEVLYSGAIPVIRRSPAMREFLDLPVIAVDDLCQISESFLRSELGRLAHSQNSLQKLKLSFWVNKINCERELLKKTPRLSAWEFVQGWAGEALRVAKKSFQ